MLRLDKLGDLERKKENALKELDAEIEAKTSQVEVLREEVDSKLATYETNKRQSIDKELESQNIVLTESKKIYEELKEQVGHKRDELNQIIEDTAKAHRERKQQAADETKLIADLKLESDKLEAETEEARTELAKLYREKAQVSGDTRKAAERHQQFIEYEQKARKELETKNTALLKKQEELGQEEKFIKARRSILPEM